MLKGYDSYKTSNSLCLDHIPSEWNEIDLFQCAEEQKKSNKDVHHQNLLSLSYGRIKRKNINSTKGLLPASFDTYQIINNGNIILRLTDLQNDHKSLRVGLATETGIITSAYLCLLNKNNALSSDYLYYVLHSFDLLKMFYSMGAGVRQSLGFGELKKVTLPVPSVEEQGKIVKYVRYKTFEIDKLIRLKKQKLTLLSELFDSKFQEIVCHSNEKIRLKRLVELECDYLIPNESEMYCKTGMYNRGRGIFRRDPIKGAELGDSKFQRIHKDRIMISGQFAWEGATYITTEDDELGIASHRYYLLKINSNVVNTEYIWAYLMSRDGIVELNNCSHGAAGRNRPLNINELLRAEIPVPSRIEALNDISEIAKMIIQSRKEQANQLELLEELKRKITVDAVIGQVDVRNVIIPEYTTDDDTDYDFDSNDIDDDSEESDEDEE